MHTITRRLAVVCSAIAVAAGFSVLMLAPVSAESQPTVSGISATFVADPGYGHHYTEYQVNAGDSDGDSLTYEWSWSGGCGAFLAGSQPDTRWYHDTSHGCSSEGSGHASTISVAVSDGHWTCTASYAGTATGTGGRATCSGGPGPSAATPRAGTTPASTSTGTNHGPTPGASPAADGGAAPGASPSACASPCSSPSAGAVAVAPSPQPTVQGDAALTGGTGTPGGKGVPTALVVGGTAGTALAVGFSVWWLWVGGAGAAGSRLPSWFGGRRDPGGP